MTSGWRGSASGVRPARAGHAGTPPTLQRSAPLDVADADAAPGRKSIRSWGGHGLLVLDRGLRPAVARGVGGAGRAPADGRLRRVSRREGGRRRRSARRHGAHRRAAGQGQRGEGGSGDRGAGAPEPGVAESGCHDDPHLTSRRLGRRSSSVPRTGLTGRSGRPILRPTRSRDHRSMVLQRCSTVELGAVRTRPSAQGQRADRRLRSSVRVVRPDAEGHGAGFRRSSERSWRGRRSSRPSSSSPRTSRTPAA